MARKKLISVKLERGLEKLADLEVTTVADLKEAAIPILCDGLLSAVKTVSAMAAKSDASDYTKLNAGNFLINVAKAFGAMDEVKTQRVVITSELANISDDEKAGAE